MTGANGVTVKAAVSAAKSTTPNCKVCEKALGEQDKRSKKFIVCCNCTAPLHEKCGLPDDEMDDAEFMFCSVRKCSPDLPIVLQSVVQYAHDQLV